MLIRFATASIIGEVFFKGEVLAGEQAAILDRALFDAVQARLTEQVNSHNTKRMKSEALLIGRIFNDRGNRMSPSYARKGSVRYRYYLSSALLQARAEDAGSIRRIAAPEIEALVVKAIKKHIKPAATMDDRSLIDTHLVRVEVHPDWLTIQLAQKSKSNRQNSTGKNILTVPWRGTGASGRSHRAGPRWLAELLANPNATAETIAARERCSVRKINMTISLAFITPDLVRAAVTGRLPRGMGVVRLADMPTEWSRQHQMLGLPENSP